MMKINKTKLIILLTISIVLTSCTSSRKTIKKPRKIKCITCPSFTFYNNIHYPENIKTPINTNIIEDIS